MNVANKIPAAQKATGVRIKSYNTFTDNKIERILHHECSLMSTPTGCIRRMIGMVGILLGLRKEALLGLSWTMFQDSIDFKDNPCLRLNEKIGGCEGDCKSRNAGLSAAK